jgi:hypothetical protein
MRCKFKMVMVAGLVLTLVGLMNLTPLYLGESLSMAAEASKWSDEVLIRLKGLPEGDHEKAIESVEIELEDGQSFPLAPNAKLKNTRNETVSLEQFTSPSKVRFVLEKGVVKEMVLIEALPR